MSTSGRIALRLAVFASVLGALAPAAPADTLSLSQVSLEYRADYLNNVFQGQYEFVVHVQGTGLTALTPVTVTRPDSTTFPLTWTGNDYAYQTVSGSFPSLQSVYPTGTYNFNVDNGAVNFNLKLDGTPPSGIVTFPASPPNGVGYGYAGGTVAYTPGNAPSSYDAFEASILRADTGQTYGQFITDVNYDIVTSSLYDTVPNSGALGPIEANREYALEYNVYQGSQGTQTIAGDTFNTYAMYGLINQSDFTASVPEPSTMCLLLVGLIALAIRFRQRLGH